MHIMRPIASDDPVACQVVSLPVTVHEMNGVGTGFFQCFDVVGRVIYRKRIVHYTYNVENRALILCSRSR